MKVYKIKNTKNRTVYHAAFNSLDDARNMVIDNLDLCFNWAIETVSDSVTLVDFRKHKRFASDIDGDIVAFFPFELATLNASDMLCYTTQGQHGTCCVQYYLETSPLDERDYKQLMFELTGQGYNLEVMQHATNTAWKYRSHKISQH